jgi:hypothetical protein
MRGVIRKAPQFSRDLTLNEQVERWAATIGRRVHEASGPITDVAAAVGLSPSSDLLRRAVDEADACSYITLENGSLVPGPEDPPAAVRAVKPKAVPRPQVDSDAALAQAKAYVAENQPVTNAALAEALTGSVSVHALSRILKDSDWYSPGKTGPRPLRGWWLGEDAHSAAVGARDEVLRAVRDEQAALAKIAERSFQTPVVVPVEPPKPEPKPPKLRAKAEAAVRESGSGHIDVDTLAEHLGVSRRALIGSLSTSDAVVVQGNVVRLAPV